MVQKVSKKAKIAREKFDRSTQYPLDEVGKLLKDLSYVKFDETVEVILNLGIDPRQSDQNVRGAVALPHGIGKTIRVLVFTKGERIQEAEAAGADYVGGEELAQKIQGGWLEFDSVVASPDMMGIVGRLGRILAPRGLMPNPKVGTVTTNIKDAVRDVKAGRVEFKANKAASVQAAVGKVSFEPKAIAENVKAFIDAVVKAKPAAAKGTYLKSAYVCGTMTPALRLNTAEFL